MKRYIVILIGLFALSFVASAQVDKQVEVTKEYAPEIGKARKMEIAPNMVDTITLRPEIDYTVTPRSFASALGTHRFNPATVTYWEYQRQYPFYLKLGAGYPLHTIGDLYAMAHRADVGYIMGYANHYGQYAKLPYKGADGNVYKDNRSLQMNNKFGVEGGKYFGRYTLAGDLNYKNDSYHRYPWHNEYAEDGTPFLEFNRRKISYEDVKLAASFGDSFADYKYLNFKVHAAADFYNDKSQKLVEGDRYQQMNVSAGVSLAREITKRDACSVDLDYAGYYGLRSLKAYNNTIAGAKLLYRHRSGGLLDMNLGVKLYYDYNPADSEKKSRWHCFPVLNVSLNIGDSGKVVPYVEVDGEVQNNSFYSLTGKNPYATVFGEGKGLLQANGVVPNTELYNVRIGVSGHTASSKFAYRFYANMSFMTNALYWYNVNQVYFDVVTARRNIWSLCGAVDYKPISQLFITAEVKGSLYDNFAKLGDVDVANAMPAIEASLNVRYTHKKFTLGMSTELYDPTKWTCVQDYSLFNPEYSGDAQVAQAFRTRTALNLNLYADWHISKTCTLFAEGNNLLGEVLPTYRWAFYREMGASFTVGVKVQF